MPAIDYVALRKGGVAVAGTPTDPIFGSDSAQRISIGVYPGAGGTAKAQITLSSPDAIEALTAKWVDWAAGDVAVDTLDSLDVPVTAIRIVATTADAAYDIIGN